MKIKTTSLNTSVKKDHSHNIQSVPDNPTTKNEFLIGIKQEFCHDCIHKNECQTPCPYVVKEILGLKEHQAL